MELWAFIAAVAATIAGIVAVIESNPKVNWAGVGVILLGLIEVVTHWPGR